MATRIGTAIPPRAVLGGGLSQAPRTRGQRRHFEPTLPAAPPKIPRDAKQRAERLVAQHTSFFNLDEEGLAASLVRMGTTHPAEASAIVGALFEGRILSSGNRQEVATAAWPDVSETKLSPRAVALLLHAAHGDTTKRAEAFRDVLRSAPLRAEAALAPLLAQQVSVSRAKLAREMTRLLEGSPQVSDAVTLRLATERLDGALDVDVTQNDAVLASVLAAVGRSNDELLIGVADGGFYLSHPELRENRWDNPKEIPGNGKDDDGDGRADDINGWNFVLDSSDLGLNNRYRDHANHVMGSATAGTDNINAVVMRVATDGSAPKGVHTAAGLRYAAERGARVINMSIKVRGAEDVEMVASVMRDFPDVLFVLSAGNHSGELGKGSHTADQNLAALPLPNLLVVAASSRSGQKAGFSAHSSSLVTVAARGAGVRSTNHSDGFATLSGTSMAAPNATNVVAKMRLIAPELSAAEVKRLVSIGADQTPYWAGYTQFGLVNPRRAMMLAGLMTLRNQGVDDAEAARRLGLTVVELADLAKRLRTPRI